LTGLRAWVHAPARGGTLPLEEVIVKKIATIGPVSLFVVAAVLVAGSAFAKKPAPPPPGGCQCPDVYDPVICSNGVIYSNLCQAGCAKASGCVPYGDASFEVQSACRCPMIWAPVICSNGRTYSNLCVANCNKAKNCVPTGDI
jgi:hypothetical protein